MVQYPTISHLPTAFSDMSLLPCYVFANAIFLEIGIFRLYFFPAFPYMHAQLASVSTIDPFNKTLHISHAVVAYPAANASLRTMLQPFFLFTVTAAGDTFKDEFKWFTTLAVNTLTSAFVSSFAKGIACLFLSLKAHITD